MPIVEAELSFCFVLPSCAAFTNASKPPPKPLPVPVPPPICAAASASVRCSHTSRHHLVPRQEGGRYGHTVDLCQPCHSSVHRFLTNRELARRYPTVEALRAAEPLQGYLSWIRKNKVEKIRNRKSGRVGIQCRRLAQVVFKIEHC